MLKLLTLNIWNYEGPWEARRELIRHWIRLLDPDLIALQEVLRNDNFNQAEVLFEGLGYHLCYGGLMQFWLDPTMQIGNLVASRWPIVDAEVMPLPVDRRGDQRELVSTMIDSPFGEICFNAVHLSASPLQAHIREQQVAALARRVIERRPKSGFPPIICGDFNASPESEPIRMMKGQVSAGDTSFFFEDAFEIAGHTSAGHTSAGHTSAGHTFTQRNTYLTGRILRDQRLDYIFVGPATGAGVVRHCDVVCHVPNNGDYPSDHFGVYAELTTNSS